jgi:hypothetical protein
VHPRESTWPHGILPPDATRPDLTVYADIPFDDLGPRTIRGRRLRRYADLALLGLCAVAVLIAVQATTRQSEMAQTANAAAASPFRTPSSPPRDPVPRLVAPATARPGESMTVLCYQHRGLCASNEILLDALPVAAQQVAIIGAALPEWDGVVFALVIPPTTLPGRHELALVGATPGEPSGADTCAGPIHRGPTATAPIRVIGREPVAGERAIRRG